MAQIKIKDLKFKYATGNRNVLDSLNLEIEKGEVILICGKSGCGKSTLLRNLKPILRPFGKMSGEILFGDKDINHMTDREQSEEIGFVLQNPENQIVTDKVWHELAFGLENLGYKKDDIRLKVCEMAEYFGITPWYYESVDKLSGGQKQLLNLAAVMAMDPSVLILDEPTAYLDPIAAENFLATLKKVNRELDVTVIISEHRLEKALSIADKVALMENGKVTNFDRPKNIVKDLENKELLKIMPVPTRVFYENKDKSSNKDVPISVYEGREWLKNFNKKSDIEYSTKEEKKELAIKCRNLCFRYDKKDRDIVKGLDLQINKGEIFAILGGNGVGKTTTFSLISGINKPYRGKIEINGKVASLPQNVQTLFNKETVREELRGVDDKIIKDMELEDLLDSHPYDISLGQQQKVALGKVLGTNPDILLLDEPTKAIDGIFKEKIGEILLKLKRMGKTIVLVSHDADFCGEYADRCGMFAMGFVIAVENTREFFSSNRFYTTTINKMTRGIIGKAIREEDIRCYLEKDNI